MPREYTNQEKMKFHKKLGIGKTIGKVFLTGAVSGAIALGVMQGINEVNARPSKSDLENKVVSCSCSAEDVNEVDKVDKVNDVNAINYSQEDKKLMQNVTYGEAGNQTRFGRQLITRMTLNRERKPEYPSNIKDVIYGQLAISCIEDKKNPNWKQATGESPRNKYEEMIYKRCAEDVNAVLDGKRLGIDFEDEIIAYHDTSINYNDLVAEEKKIQEKWKKKGKRWDGYWMHLEPVIQEDDLIFYKEKGIKLMENLKNSKK